MNIKKIVLIALVLFLSTSLLTAAYAKKKTMKRSDTATFLKGDLFVTPQIGLYGGSVPFGASLEFAMTENIGVGGTLMAWFGSGWSVFMPAVEAAYHFTMLEVEKLDLFAGAGIGFAVVGGGGITGTSGISVNPFIAGRYYFSDKMGVSLKVNIGLIGDWTGVGSMLGVVFRL